MNPTILTDYQQKLSIAMAKIEAFEAVLANINTQVYSTKIHPNCAYELHRIQSATMGMIKGIKDRIHTHWQTLEPQAEDYGWQTGDDSWDSVLNAQRYNMAHARWQNIEPFKTIQNDPA